MLNIHDSAKATIGKLSNSMFLKVTGGSANAVFEAVKLSSIFRPPVASSNTQSTANAGSEAAGNREIRIKPKHAKTTLLSCFEKTTSFALMVPRILPVNMTVLVPNISVKVPNNRPMNENDWSFTPKIRKAPRAAKRTAVSSNGIGSLASILHVRSNSVTEDRPMNMVAIDAGR